MESERTSVLVTGAAGFLGRWFVREHARLGHLVLGIDDLSNPHSFWPEELPVLLRHQEKVEWWLQRALNGFEKPQNEVGLTKWDIVYHFAAPVGGREKIEGDPLFNAGSLTIDTLLFRWAIKRAGIVVYPSSSAVYGTRLQQGLGERLREESFRPSDETWDSPDEMYGFTKMAGEYLAWKSSKYGLNTLCIRPFSGYGEEQSLEYPVPSILTRIKARENPVVIWGTAEQRRDFIHVSDVVGATLARLDAGIRGYQVMNIASGKPVSFRRVANIAADLAGYKPEIAVDISKPVGVSSRYGDPRLMRRYYTPKVELREGLARVLESLP